MKHLSSQLGEFNGTILSDGYKAYDLYSASVNTCNVARCWVHCRRYFERAETSEPDACAMALVYIGKLYKIEKDIRENTLQGEKKRQYRLEHAKPVVDAFFHWAHEARQNPELVAGAINISLKLVFWQAHRDDMANVKLNVSLTCRSMISVFVVSSNGSENDTLVDHEDYRTQQQAKQSLFQCLEVFYNRKRYSCLGYLSPDEKKQASDHQLNRPKNEAILG